MGSPRATTRRTGTAIGAGEDPTTILVLYVLYDDDSIPFKPLVLRIWPGSPSYCIVAGLALHYQKKVSSPQRHGADFDLPINFELALCKILQVAPKHLRTTFA
jgi:hypothetical protein